MRPDVIKFEARATHNKILSQNNNLGQVQCHIPISQFLRKLRQENHLSVPSGIIESTNGSGHHTACCEARFTLYFDKYMSGYVVQLIVQTGKLGSEEEE